MATVRVEHNIGDLARDLRQIPRDGARQVPGILRKNARAGTRRARANAKRTAGRHGKHYPKSITTDRSVTPSLFGGMGGSIEYGPDASKRQGGMSFEYGSRNQPPHMDLNKSADVQGPFFHADINQMIDGLFWPGGDR